MSEIRDVEIKKSQIAMYKGVGLNVKEMAEKFNVPSAEIKEAMAQFGMGKAKPKKDYNIVLIDDMKEIEPEVENGSGNEPEDGVPNFDPEEASH